MIPSGLDHLHVLFGFSVFDFLWVQVWFLFFVHERLGSDEFQSCNSLLFDQLANFLNTSFGVGLTIFVEIDANAHLLELLVCIKTIVNEFILELGKKLLRGGSLAHLTGWHSFLRCLQDSHKFWLFIMKCFFSLPL